MAKKFSLGNLGGTLYFSDVPLFRFKFIRDYLVSIEMIVSREDKRLPIEFEINKLSDNEKLHVFFEDRTTPETRYGVQESMRNSPIKYYYPERIIRYSNGRSVQDPYWLECDNDETCWK